MRMRQKMGALGLTVVLPMVVMSSALAALAISPQRVAGEVIVARAAANQDLVDAPLLLAQTNPTATETTTPEETPEETPASTETATPTATTGITATPTVTAPTGVTTTTGATTTTGVTTTNTATTTIPASITVTTVGIPTNFMSGTLPDLVLSLMTPVTRETPTADMQAVLDALMAFGAPPIPDQSARNARKLPGPKDAVMAVLASRGESVAPEPVGSISHLVIPSPAPDGTLLRILTPAGAGPFPVVVYFHGGGFVIAGLDAYEPSARALVNAANSIVVMVGYRQAPEAQYPAALEDSFAAYQWVLNNAATINGDPSRVAVVGESAGGNLATGVALVARDRGEQLPVYQVLVYPISQWVSDQTPSYATYADAMPLSRAAMQWFAVRALPNAGTAFDPYASPLLMDDLSGLPPATLITAAIDPLQSDGAAYAARLQEDGVEVVYQNFPGVTHEFFGMGAVLPEAQDAVQLAAEGLLSAFGAAEATPANATGTLTGTTTLTRTIAPTSTNNLTGRTPLTNSTGITATTTPTR